MATKPMDAFGDGLGQATDPLFVAWHSPARTDDWQPAPDRRVPTYLATADGLFRALDGRAIMVSNRRCLLEVFGIVDEAECRWVQLAVHGLGHRMLTLRLELGDGLTKALAAVYAALMPEPIAELLAR